jgi:hypothetical protein
MLLLVEAKGDVGFRKGNIFSDLELFSLDLFSLELFRPTKIVKL